MDFKKYATYSVESFLEDPAFRNWIKHPTAESDRFWKDFSVQYANQESTIKQSRYILSQMNEYFAGTDQAPADDAFRQVLLQTMEEAKDRKKAKSQKLRFSRLLFIAASFALVLVAISWFWLKPNNQLQTIATGFGEWKTIELPDGSTVKLNADSEIQLANNWAKDAERKVWLTGEAFFNVEKKPATNAKFQVITKDLTIEVFGTSFNVHSRGEQTNVFLEEGQIKLDWGGQDEYLDPGDFVAYSAEKKMITQRHKASAERYISWKNGTLILKDTPVIEILNKIEEIYGLTVRLENKAILSQEKTIMVPMDKIEIAIPILEITLNAKIEKKDNQLIIK